MICSTAVRVVWYVVNGVDGRNRQLPRNVRIVKRRHLTPAWEAAFRALDRYKAGETARLEFDWIEETDVTPTKQTTPGDGDTTAEVPRTPAAERTEGPLPEIDAGGGMTMDEPANIPSRPGSAIQAVKGWISRVRTPDPAQGPEPQPPGTDDDPPTEAGSSSSSDSDDMGGAGNVSGDAAGPETQPPAPVAPPPPAPTAEAAQASPAAPTAGIRGWPANMFPNLAGLNQRADAIVTPQSRPESTGSVPWWCFFNSPPAELTGEDNASPDTAPATPGAAEYIVETYPETFEIPRPEHPPLVRSKLQRLAACKPPLPPPPDSRY